MANTIIGTILQIGTVQDIPTKSGNQFRKRELVLDASSYDQYTGEKRENYPSFNFLQKHVDDLNNFKIGDRVIVSFFLSGRRWEKDGEVKYFNDVVGFKIEPFTANQGSQSSQIPAPSQSPTQAQATSQNVSNGGQQGITDTPPFPPNAEGDDDMPF